MKALFTGALPVLLALVCQGPVLAQSEIMDRVEALNEAWTQEQAAIDAIRELGGWVELGDCPSEELREHLDPDKRRFVIEVNMVYHEEGGVRSDNSNLTADALPHIGKCSQVQRVLLTKTQANDQGLAHLAGLKHVQSIYMWDASAVTDEGLQHFSDMQQLRKLHVSKSGITDQGIGHLTGLPNIQGLSLQGNRFTNEIFVHAARFDELRSLWVGLGQNKMSDEGLEALRSCQQLETLGIQQSGFSDEATERLKQHLPKLEKLYK